MGGYLAGSLAIMSDAAHLLSDCISFIVALLAIIWAKKSPNNHMTFGYKRVGKCLHSVNITSSTVLVPGKHVFSIFVDFLFCCYCFLHCRGFRCDYINIWYLVAYDIPILFCCESFNVPRF